MALISDPDYLIHKIRLNYLREADDPYGPRILSFDSQHALNSYIDVAGFSDSDRWPEINMPSSPNLSDDEALQGERPSGFPGARLKHSHTIMGGRTGAVGMRVHGKRHSTSKRLSLKLQQRKLLDEEQSSQINPDDETQDPTTRKRTANGDSFSLVKKSVSTDGILLAPNDALPDLLKPQTDPLTQATDSTLVPDISLNIQQPTIPEEAPVQKIVQFIPKFRNASEMERRRQLRMAARRGPGASVHPPPTPQPTDISSSSSEDEPAPLGIDDVSSSSDSSLSPDSDFANDADEFDPEFAASRVASDSLTTPSSAGSLILGSQLRDRPRASSTSRLSPVSEKPPSTAATTTTTTPEFLISTTSDAPNSNSTSAYFPPRRLDNGPGSQHTQPNQGHAQQQHPQPQQQQQQQQQQPQQQQPNTRPRTSSHPNPTSDNSPHPTTETLFFTKSPIKPISKLVPPQRSALTVMLLAHSSSGPNPYSETYAAISGRGSLENMFVRVFFPHAVDPRGEALELNVRRDAIIEEVLGFALWSYWEEGWLPRLNEGLAGNGGSGGDDVDGDGSGSGGGGGGSESMQRKRDVTFSAVGWTLRIAEEDGEVDDDFPPPDRTAKAIKFNSCAFALLKATPIQVEQNSKIESYIERRTAAITPSNKKGPGASTVNVAAAEKSTTNLTVNAADVSVSSSSHIGSFAGVAGGGGAGGESVSASLGMGPSGSRGPQIFLRITIDPDTPQSLKTIGVSSTVYMQEVLELVCKKCNLLYPKDYVLLLRDQSIMIPLDRTVASLEGIRELKLVKKSILPGLLTNQGEEIRVAGKTTDPNASIFKRMSDGQGVNGKGGFSVLDPTSTYKKYIVTRKVPMLVAGRERTLAIDGVYVHIMPGGNKARPVFDSAKTESFHIKSIVDCQQSGKSQAFKIVLNGSKRREYEAETPKLAGEIVATIKNIKTNLDRSTTMKHASAAARRSRLGA